MADNSWETPSVFGLSRTKFGGGGKSGVFGVGTGELGMSDEELSKYISELLKNLGTQGEAAYNRASELTYDAPEATKLAAQRNVGYTTAVAGEKGITGLEQFQKGINRDAWRTILDARLRKYGIDTQADIAEGDIISDLLGTIGGGLGFGFGASLFGGD
jgi:hypothetical protein